MQRMSLAVCILNPQASLAAAEAAGAEARSQLEALRSQHEALAASAAAEASRLGAEAERLARELADRTSQRSRADEDVARLQVRVGRIWAWDLGLWGQAWLHVTTAPAASAVPYTRQCTSLILSRTTVCLSRAAGRRTGVPLSVRGGGGLPRAGRYGAAGGGEPAGGDAGGGQQAAGGAVQAG